MAEKDEAAFGGILYPVSVRLCCRAALWVGVGLMSDGCNEVNILPVRPLYVCGCWE